MPDKHQKHLQAVTAPVVGTAHSLYHFPLPIASFIYHFQCSQSSVANGQLHKISSTSSHNTAYYHAMMTLNIWVGKLQSQSGYEK